MAQLVKHLFCEHKDPGSMKSGCGRMHWNPNVGSQESVPWDSLSPNLSYQWAPGQPDTLIPLHKSLKNNTGTYSLLSTHKWASAPVYTCLPVHTWIHTHKPNLPSLYSCKNIFPMECRSLHESGVGSDDHTVLSRVCSELLWTVAALYFVIEHAYSSDNHEHSSRLIWHPFWWHSLSDAGKEPSRQPLCHIWESAMCLFTCRQPRSPPLGAALMLVSFNKQILCVSVSPHHVHLELHIIKSWQFSS